MHRAKNPWLVCSKRKSHAVLRLLCLPYAGGGASVFYDWVQHLPETIEVWSIQYPGRESRINEKPFTNLSGLAQAICQILQHTCDIPFALYGHSVGALLGFEVTRVMRRNRQSLPLCVFVSGCASPHLKDPDPPLHVLPEPEFLEKLRAFNGTPEIILENSELRQIFIPTLRADLTLRETYTYNAEPPLDCPIIAYGGIDDPEVSHEDLEQWNRHTNASFHLSMFPGDHFFLHTAKTALLQRLSQDLSQYTELLTSRRSWSSTLERSL